MGIMGLTRLLSEKAPQCFKEDQIKNYFGRAIAIDASMSMYQFLIAMKGVYDGPGAELIDEEGQVTSHLKGMWTRSIRLVSEGIKPIYVFDGAPPEMKRKELEERRAKAEEARAALEKAQEEGNEEEIEKLSKRTVRVSKEQTEECKRLLRLMGLPVVEAKTEAEAQAAELVLGGKAWGVGTEDMDALTFGTPILVRHLNYTDAKKQPILEFHTSAVLEGLGLTREQFVDLCILMGCDYCPRIQGIGPVKAYEGIKTHKSIEAFLKTLEPTKYKVPDNYPFQEARKLFLDPEVFPAKDICVDFRDPDEEGLIKFLVEEKKFGRERVEAGIAKLKKARQRKEQSRLDSFFTITPKLGGPGKKRPAETKGPKMGAKKPKGAGGKKAVVK